MIEINIKAKENSVSFVQIDVGAYYEWSGDIFRKIDKYGSIRISDNGYIHEHPIEDTLNKRLVKINKIEAEYI